MCGVVGIASQDFVSHDIFDALLMLQHRGQDAAGIHTLDKNGRIHKKKNSGLVSEIFRLSHLNNLVGNFGIGHVRYPTHGSSKKFAAQPFYVNAPYGISVAHNGNLTNADELAEIVIKEDFRHLNTNSDSEILLNIFAHELMNFKSLFLTPLEVFDAMEGVYKRIRGGFAVVSLVAGIGLVGFRDPFGLRPLVLGKKKTKNNKTNYILASESVALDVLGYELVRDVEPGEVIIVDLEGNLHCQTCCKITQTTPCIFEYVYLARPDSFMDGVSVYQSRMQMGKSLAQKIIREYGEDHDIDVIIPIPETSRTAALEVAKTLNIPYREGFIKNRYIARTFIMPEQGMRELSVKRKLNPIASEFNGKNVLLVDDSIVRGTTSAQIVKIAKQVGAKQVFFASAAPPIRYPYVYGIDMPSQKDLLAFNKDVEEMRKLIGAERLIFQDLEDLIDAVLKINPKLKKLDTSCFNGSYVTGDITAEYLKKLAQTRQ